VNQLSGTSKDVAKLRLEIGELTDELSQERENVRLTF